MPNTAPGIKEQQLQQGKNYYMGVYTADEKVQIIKDNPAKALLEAARKTAKILNMHITGEGLRDAIEGMSYFERPDIMKMRRKYARSNKDLFERLFRPRDKVFTARGGSKSYSLPQSKENTFRTYLSTIMYGLPLEKWIQSTALKAYDIDPMSLIFMEIDPDGFVYPTYKSTDCIYDYSLDGRRPEYVVFTLSQAEINQLVSLKLISVPEKGAIVYRFVDDITDCFIIRNSEEFNFPATGQLVNFFLEVPGIIASDVKKFNSDLFESSAEIVVELANEFLIDGSTKIIAKKHHMFPKAWEVKTDCPACNGEKYVEGKTCGTCNGSGVKPYTQVSDVIKISPADDRIKIPIPPGGYYTPDRDGWEMMNEEQESLEFLMERTMWGAKRQIKAQGPSGNSEPVTATEVQYENQPMEARLKDFSTWAERMHKYVADMVGRILFKTVYTGSSIVYGDRYMLESPDQIWIKYEKARKSGSPITTLDSHLAEFYESKYYGNPSQLQKHLILMRVEPFVHYDVNTVMGWTIPEVEKLKKVYYGEWLASKSDMDILSSNEVALRDELKSYAEQNKPAPSEMQQERETKAA